MRRSPEPSSGHARGYAQLRAVASSDQGRPVGPLSARVHPVRVADPIPGVLREAAQGDSWGLRAKRASHLRMPSGAERGINQNQSTIIQRWSRREDAGDHPRARRIDRGADRSVGDPGRGGGRQGRGDGDDEDQQTHRPSSRPRIPATNPPGASPATIFLTRSIVFATLPSFSAAVSVLEYAAQTSAPVISYP